MQYRKTYIIVIISLLLQVFLYSCKDRPITESEDLTQAREWLWKDPIICLNTLNSIDTTSLKEGERMEYHLLLQQAWIRQYSQLAPDTMSSRLIDYFASHHYPAKEGEAYYLKATEQDILGNSEEAMKNLKIAEQRLNESQQAPAELLGAMYYRMGKLSETDMLYNIAHEYYQKALFYLIDTEQYLYIACTYRDLGRTARDSINTQEQRDYYFSKALQTAAGHCDTAIYLNILSYQLRFQKPIDTLQLQQINRYLCLNRQYKRAAAELTEYFLEQHELDSASYYLNIFAEDTTNLDWSREKYHYLHSKLMFLQRKYEQSETELRHLYDKQTQQLAADGKARTYAISQRFDVLKARETALEKQVKLQYSYLIITILIILLLLGAGIATIFVFRTKHQKMHDEQQIRELQNEVRHKRELLKNTLEQRVKLSKELQNSRIFQRKKSGEVPDWAKEYIDNSLFASREQWEDFQREFNIISNDFLTKLKQEYAELTNVDLQIIALIITGLSISDICILLNQTKNTIWSRRQRIKTHLSLTTDDKLDQWLLNKYETSI